MPLPVAVRQSLRPLALCLLLGLATRAQADAESFEYLSSTQAREAMLARTEPGAPADGPSAFGALDYSGIAVAHSQVPEPDAYLQILAGLGLLGFVARRRYRHAAPD